MQVEYPPMHLSSYSSTRETNYEFNRKLHEEMKSCKRGILTGLGLGFFCELHPTVEFPLDRSGKPNISSEKRYKIKSSILLTRPFPKEIPTYGFIEASK